MTEKSEDRRREFGVGSRKKCQLEFDHDHL